MMGPWTNWIALGAIMLVSAGPAVGVTDAVKCEATKLKVAGKYNFCRLKAEAAAIKSGDPVDYSKCDFAFGQKWLDGETKGGGMCPTSGDLTGVRNKVTADTDVIAQKLTGVCCVDNSDDGTVSDPRTGLMWEKKDDLGGIHDKDNLYMWSVVAGPPDGTAFVTFLGTLNNGTTSDGTTISGCFAGHCDWRLPTSAELQTILLAPFPCSTNPCIDAAFGLTQSGPYWSATTYPNDAPLAWVVDFSNGFKTFSSKAMANSNYVRAVRTR